jgi:hypothetical protein
MTTFINTMALATRYGVSVQTVSQWPRFKNFPEDARKRVGRDMLWNVDATDQYLRNRPLGKRGTRPTWLKIVGHKDA